jgi:2',3'-cyclic-nucleotide 2'-phosphodiesterase (5'-nucleotidase family)
MTKDASGNDVVLVNTDGGWRYVGQLTVEFDQNGNVMADGINDTTSTIHTATDETAASLWGSEEAAYAEGSKGDIAQKLVGAVDALVTAKDSITFGMTDVYLQGERTFVRTEETNLGNLTADANLWYARQLDDAVMVSIKNGGGIREPIGTTYAVGSEGDYELRPPQANQDAAKQEGEISQLDIESSLRFNNDLSILTLTRAQLLAVLEHAVSASEEGATPGQFAQVSGIRYSFDWNREPGDRIESAAIVDESGVVQDVLVVNGELVGDLSANIKIVTLGFMADGGDGYPFSEFLELNPQAVARIDLMEAQVGEGLANEAAAGTEQDAFAEYMLSQFSDRAFDQVDTEKTQDQRIQNLAYREDDVLADNTDAVVRLYDTLFDRTPDQAGLAYWHNELATELNLQQITAAFMASDEYGSTLGQAADNEELIQLLYRNAFDREAEKSGLDYWSNELDTQSAARVILGISESQEHIDLLL